MNMLDLLNNYNLHKDKLWRAVEQFAQRVEDICDNNDIDTSVIGVEKYRLTLQDVSLQEGCILTYWEEPHDPYEDYPTDSMYWKISRSWFNMSDKELTDKLSQEYENHLAFEKSKDIERVLREAEYLGLKVCNNE